MFGTYFTQEQLIPLLPSLFFLLLSLVLYVKGKRVLALAFLLLGALGLRVFAALLDPFVNIWDEQFHALVARHMMEDPFTPMLYKKHVLPYDESNWSVAHIWMHKQPLFQWQMALSMKLFGVNEFAMRLPSVLLSTAVVFFIYRIGKITVNERVGYYSAFLFGMSFFAIELAGGTMNTDHNDADFTAYVTASIWAWVEFLNSGKKRWRILVGVFVGCALLVKWLPGILVFSGWGMWVLLDKERRMRCSSYVQMLSSDRFDHSASLAGLCFLAMAQDKRDRIRV
jgi:4-amino-4-deoxy-L-arabinose transferase-like glycosyltransferase